MLLSFWRCAGAILNTAAHSPELAAEFTHTVDALSAQLPLVQLVKRLEFVKHRLAIFSSSLEPPAHNRIQRELVLKTELNNLNSEIQHQISRYEAVNKQIFMYRGRPFQANMNISP